MPFTNHLNNFESLITPYSEIRAGFIAMALEKNKRATPFIEEAKALKVIASQARFPKQLIDFENIQESLLTASGISDKARNHLTPDDKKLAILGLIENFLDPAGTSFVDELVYRFLLTRGDSLGGAMRNLAGTLGEWKFTRILLSTLSIYHKEFHYLDLKTRQWIKSSNQPELERSIKGVFWETDGNPRTLIYNINVPIVKKNVDLCLLNSSYQDVSFHKNKVSSHQQALTYIALGEIKGGIDPAGADEHWKTANSALNRIRNSFSLSSCNPKTFFIGAAIEKAMAQEIFHQLNEGIISNAANLTNEQQMVSICSWLVEL
ncbi:AvaI/BsoBI family type II restriction endonuclease [Legionella londiniensis]|uniref:Type-2 restriction enzyme BsoBI n=1 Tax=Legionella londiniensis TaxID=45068 RepID=A0A0W0VJ20_9GAMM|nr:AvaI/BsoBI family type II restriction endonuclease [Legionella londiniensis]KTD20114.1 Type-2 restriction enzyme BsoBI [Legionella londiniensis]STX94281.1 Type-2 restriction enzyme BsoBI [Legionella londiniensis]